MLSLTGGKLVHGHTVGGHTSTYTAWAGAIGRCFCKTHKRYALYGGRGITVCERWRSSFENFLVDMGECPEGLTLDRRDNDGNYELANCHWATKAQQAQNRRTTRNLTHGGKTQCVDVWAREIGVHKTVIHKRLNLGWSIEKVLTTPRRQYSRKANNYG